MFPVYVKKDLSVVISQPQCVRRHWPGTGQTTLEVIGRNDANWTMIKGRYISSWGNPTSQLLDVTCDLGSRSVTCHPTQVNTPSHAGWYLIYLPWRDGRLNWPSCLDSAPAGSRTSDLLIASLTPNHCTTMTTTTTTMYVMLVTSETRLSNLYTLQTVLNSTQVY